MLDSCKMVEKQSEVFHTFLCHSFPSLKQNFIAYRSSKVSDCIFEIHQPWQSGFSRVYSNYCCSCSLEREIIKISQSSHKMYSNNILNFQESTTILNAHTKKVWKLIVCASYFERHLQMLYSHYDINHNSNTNAYTNTGGLFRFRYERVYQFLASVHGDTSRETQFLKKPILIIIWWLHPNTRRILWFLRSQFIPAGRDLKKSTAFINSRKLNYPFNDQILNCCLFKILKFSGPSLLDMTSSTLQSHFLSGGLLWQMVIVISFPCERKTAPNDYAPRLRDPIGSKPFLTEW